MGDQFEPASRVPREAAGEGKRGTFRRKIDCTAPGATRDGTSAVREPEGRPAKGREEGGR